MDATTSGNLHVVSEDEHPAATKAGKYSASKEGVSLLALLSRTASPMAQPVLRYLNKNNSMISSDAGT